MPKTHKKKTQLARLCRCIKAVGAPESRAIPICIKSVLHRRGRTIKRFSCAGSAPHDGKGMYLITQPMIRGLKRNPKSKRK